GPLPHEYIPNHSETSIWYLLPHQHRDLTHNQKHNVEVKINNFDNHWELRLCTDNLVDVFYQVEFFFSSEAILNEDNLENIDDRQYFWRKGVVDISQGKDKLQIESGAQEHWQIQLVKSELISQMKVLKVNLMSPID